jgi:Flp pilus assembly protein TadD
MRMKNLRGTAVLVAAGLALAGCATGRPQSPTGLNRPEPAESASCRQAFQLDRKAASLAEISDRNIGCSSIDGEYLLAGTSRPSASAMART